MAKHDVPGKRDPGEKASRESSIIKYSSDAILTVTNESLIDSWNPAAEQIYGYTAEEAVGKPITLIFPPDRIDEEDRLLARLSGGEDIPPYETIRVRKDGTQIEVSLSLSPIKDSSGRIAGSSRIARDITEEKRSRRELEAAHARYKSTLDNMMEGGQIVDGDFRYVYLNDVAAKHGRLPKDKLIGMKMTEAYPGIENTEMFALLKDCISNRLSHKLRNRFEYPDGAVAWFDLSIEPVPEGAFVLSIDVTEEKRMMEELQKSHEGLESLVKERTEKLEEANKELESFSYSVSHDLRAPLRHIDGFVDLLRKHAADTLDEKSTRYLKTISSSARTMGTLIDELLVFSRMGRSEMRSAPVDTPNMVREVIDGFQNETAGRTIKWRIDVLPTVNADPSMLKLVFVNLISNAIKYTGKSAAAEIRVGSRYEGEEIIFFVSDNGVGFDMQYADKLFGVFQRLHRQEDFDGVGIGLANVRRIVRRHGGRTWAESKLNEGATFYFSLPKNFTEVHDERN